MTKMVFNLWYEREYRDRSDTELHIGIYSSEAEAKAAITQLRDKDGFRDFPDGFKIYPTNLNQTGWKDGFVSILESDMIKEGYEPMKSNALLDVSPRSPGRNGRRSED